MMPPLTSADAIVVHLVNGKALQIQELVVLTVPRAQQVNTDGDVGLCLLALVRDVL